MKTILKMLRAALLILSTLVLTKTFSSHAAVANVTIQNFAFSPTATTINPGDQVVWTWSNNGGVPHTSTSDSGDALAWDSGSKTSPAVFTNTFPSAGVFPYHCTFHVVSHNMTGTITVNAPANVPPTISITNPAANAIFSAPANVTVQASAADSGGSVASVQFFADSTIFATVNSAPFSATANNLGAGSHILSAIVSDNLGAKATNTITISVVTPVALNLGAIARADSGSFQFNYAANVGLKYVVQRSTNLISGDWISLVTNTASDNPVVFTNDNATNSPAFYRVGRLPNP